MSENGAGKTTSGGGAAPSDVEVRPAVRRELPLLVPLDPPGTGLSAARVGHAERGELVYLVAWAGEEPLGSVEVVPGQVPELRNLHVLPQYRSRGVGSALIAAAESHVQPAPAMRLGVGLDNPRAKELYVRLGYVPTGVLSTDEYDYVDAQGVTRHAVETSEELRKPLRG